MPVKPQRECPDQPTEQEKTETRINKKKFSHKLYWIVTATIALLVFIFLILPALFILLGVMWPETFSGAAAAEQLRNNVNSLVGVVSLAVGIFSIYYSYTANKSMETQSQSQQRFLEELRNENSQIIQKLSKIDQTSQQVFDKINNLREKRLRGPAEANEE